MERRSEKSENFEDVGRVFMAKVLLLRRRVLGGERVKMRKEKRKDLISER